ncbi:DUF1491 family protein [Zymomonas mobilis]|uniref:DUF1491 family protein n=1 Tax=Zymomonas mobilis TaxID=542 RepID=UPI0003C7582E|nr:DUF1491 family protein [Zymomonas mobilis]AHB10479.1 hypothetical protein ZCP4_1184 [Zymomonas mobilis subsp. mobilis str. CP4 = NRRL B-14023]AHJ70785.1 hypothetical protein A254_01174 [Zymomonas mobilis subsp. mobilis NRRL B-12526]AHJ72638.1 hypothetical protein A265_01175 [Zymomonas mobilis subsp. mobilis str. CP4 = NRRL B-14023]TWE24571.1 hypothetical protein FBY52_11137 [Zymomonas mobilis]
MTEPRLATHILVKALLRQMDTAGQSMMVLKKGEAEAGSLILVIAEQGRPLYLLERAFLPEGRYGWGRAAIAEDADESEFTRYIDKRKRFDPDLWIIELEGRQSESLALSLLA